MVSKQKKQVNPMNTGKEIRRSTSKEPLAKGQVMDTEDSSRKRMTRLLLWTSDSEKIF